MLKHYDSFAKKKQFGVQAVQNKVLYITSQAKYIHHSRRHMHTTRQLLSIQICCILFARKMCSFKLNFICSFWFVVVFNISALFYMDANVMKTNTGNEIPQ